MTEPANLTALAAIMARINGEFDHPALVAFGPLAADVLADVSAIARHSFDAAVAALSVDQLSTALYERPVAHTIMNAADVLAEFGLSSEEFDESEEAAAERLDKAGRWLASNRKHIEEAMSRAGFEAISVLASGPEDWKLD